MSRRKGVQATLFGYRRGTDQKYSDSDRRRVIRLYKDGLTVKAIFEKTGVSEPYVKTLIRRAGLTIRPAGFQPGNPGRAAPHSVESKEKMRQAHIITGHRPTKEASDKGRPGSIRRRWGNHVKDPVGMLYRLYADGAAGRGLTFALSREQFCGLIGKPCHYCNAPPTERKINVGIRFVTNGIGPNR